MRMTREAKFGLWLLAALAVAAASFFVGTLLKPGEEPYYLFDTEAPAFQDPSPVAATSPGGFTGFGETDGSRSRVVLSGRVIELSDSSITLEGTLGQKTELAFGESPRIFRLTQTGLDGLQTGAAVAVQLDDKGETAEALLITSRP